MSKIGERVRAKRVTADRAELPSTTEQRSIATLAREASVEMTWHDVGELGPCRSSIAPGTAVFVSHLPGQTWRKTVETCTAVRDHGFEPVPHIPVRRLTDRTEFARLTSDLVADAHVSRVLLIAGDAPQPDGAFAATLDALETGVLAEHGIRRIFVAGHPEGHPRLSDDELRRAERDKLAFAASHDLELVFLTQFFFEPAPFVSWARMLRAEGVGARLVAGLAGPARLTTLFKYALRCGVGASIRALGARPAQLARLTTERDPEPIVRAIAGELATGELGDIGIHLFSFGGLARTCGWLQALAA
jgi:methylenetetrahydrofolate reductase (NADPH)